jgi:TolB-like protein
MPDEAPGTPKAPTEAPVPSAPPREPTVRLRLLQELRRRNVLRVAVLYLIACWLILEPTHVIFHMLEVPPWANRLVVLLMAIGFPAVLLFAWVYEITPEGLKPTAEVEPHRSIRKQTAQRLNRAIVAMMAVALAYFVVDKFWISKRSPSAPPTTYVTSVAPAPALATPAISDRSVAVLPFVDMSEKKDQEYFSDGLSEQLIDMLTKIPDLRVPARTSSFYFKARSEDVPTIARRLLVAHVLEGSVRKSGQQLRITAQLVRADTGYHVWSETYDRRLDDIFKIQDEIAGAVVRALKLRLLDSPSSRERRTANPEAYNQYLIGRQFFVRGNWQDYRRAMQAYRKAVDLDPDYAPAWPTRPGGWRTARTPQAPWRRARRRRARPPRRLSRCAPTSPTATWPALLSAPRFYGTGRAQAKIFSAPGSLDRKPPTSCTLMHCSSCGQPGGWKGRPRPFAKRSTSIRSTPGSVRPSAALW